MYGLSFTVLNGRICCIQLFLKFGATSYVRRVIKRVLHFFAVVVERLQVCARGLVQRVVSSPLQFGDIGNVLRLKCAYAACSWSGTRGFASVRCRRAKRTRGTFWESNRSEERRGG